MKSLSEVFLSEFLAISPPNLDEKEQAEVTSLYKTFADSIQGYNIKCHLINIDEPFFLYLEAINTLIISKVANQFLIEGVSEKLLADKGHN